MSRLLKKNGKIIGMVFAVILAVIIVFTTTYQPVFAQEETGAAEEAGSALFDDQSEEEILETETETETETGTETETEAGTEIETEATEPVPEETAAPEWEEETETEVTEDALSVAVFTGETDRETGKKIPVELQTVSATADGNTYAVTVTGNPDAGIPAGARLQVAELTEEDPEYASYLEQTAELINSDASDLFYIKLLDISIIDENGNKVTPASAVDVQIRLLDNEEISDTTQIVHFGEEAEILDSTVDGDTVSFETTGFSAYAIVDGPGTVPVGWHKVVSIDELSQDKGFYIGHTKGYYFTSGITQISASRTGITKTKPAASAPPAAAVEYYFEHVQGGANNQFKVYCLKEGVKSYIIQNTNSLNLTSNEEDATVFTIENGAASDVFRAQGGTSGYYWNMQGGESGASFAAYTGAGDENAQFHFWYYEEPESDPYDLENAPRGLMNWNGGAAGKAMMGTSSSSGSLDAKPLTVMSTRNNGKQLFVPNESDIAMWNFHWVEADLYHMTTVVDGSTRYLRIGDDGVSLVSIPDENCKIQVIPGTGIHEGEISLKAGGRTLTYSGSVETGFSTSGTVGAEWLKLVDLSELTSDYLRTYTARKVSVSDPNITNGSKVIVYTRYWNESTKRYDYYAINHDGSLIPVAESGDTIEWKGGQFNELLWTFTEYYWDGTSDPNYYYELYNQYSEKYIAPQVTDGQILSSDTIGINLNGRRDGHYYSTILAWDETNYTFAGLKVENGQIVSCPKREAMDFYFAEMEELNLDDNPLPVETVDHTQYGITMKIVDLDNSPNNKGYMSQFLGSSAGGAGIVLDQGLLSPQLGEDGYPVTTAENSGGSLKDLYEHGVLREVNHLFIMSTYEETGYFTYDSTQNFATLLDAEGNVTNDFTVYKELGTHDATSKPTLKHGQFFPFNDLKPGEFATLNDKNLYTFNESSYELLLPDSDPRKYEKMYTIGPNPDYWFAVELEASFVQTPSGLDDWGHDIIFEFTGDDDFWLYVDGELVLDLGGIHSSVPGSVNFRTGEVRVNGQTTTLRQIFKEHYERSHPGATEDDVLNYLKGIFGDGEDSTVFKDNSPHTMRIFYMERGASASNLRMRFNLAAIKEGTVELTKQLGGVDDPELVMAEFPYQIFYKYKTETGEEKEARLTNAIPDTPQNDDYVLYKDSVNPVKYLPSIEIGGVTYEDVFFLKPGESAEISFPEGMTSYRIVECGINTDVYDEVKANGTTVTGSSGEGYPENRKDFGIDDATTNERPRVTYENIVDPDAIKNLTIQKLLFDESGTEPIHYPTDKTPFTFRLYMAPEFEELELTNMHTYFVKDGNGYYCRWDADNATFVPLDSRKTDFSQLTPEEKEAASFNTSIYGTIAEIPADHTVEIRNVLAGTQFRVQERPWEIPDGYSFQRYVYNGVDSTKSAEEGIQDVVTSSEDPAVVVRNLKGWGLRMNKTWSDEGYMSERAPAYFAIYIKKNGETEFRYVEKTLRQLQFQADPQSLYWYFPHLEQDTSFDDYKIREVTISGDQVPVVDADGYVTNDTEFIITRIENGGTVSISGKQKGETESSSFSYTVQYGESIIPEESGNVRIDPVTNYRPGIVLNKTKWDAETPLAGAVFTLQDNDENEIGTFTSDENGLITVAFLRKNIPYTLTEISSPSTWFGLAAPLYITLDESGEIQVNYSDDDYYVVDNESDPHTLTIKNRPYQFEARKIDGDTEETDNAMAGVTFALHREITVDGVTGFDVNPMPGYEQLITDSEGVIPKLDNTLPAGKYQLREMATLPGYQLLSPYVEFTVSATGMIELLGTHPEATLTGPTPEEDGTVSFVLTIANHHPPVDIGLKKVDSDNEALLGSKFQLCRSNGTYWDPVSGYEVIDLTGTSQMTLEELNAGLYRLTEILAPDGYVILSQHVYFLIAYDNAGNVSVKLTDESGEETSYSNVALDVSGATALITVTNIAGEQLPKTGGPGTLPFTIGGIALILSAVLIFVLKKMKDNKEREQKS